MLSFILHIQCKIVLFCDFYHIYAFYRTLFSLHAEQKLLLYKEVSVKCITTSIDNILKLFWNCYACQDRIIYVVGSLDWDVYNYTFDRCFKDNSDYLCSCALKVLVKPIIMKIIVALPFYQTIERLHSLACYQNTCIKGLHTT